MWKSVEERKWMAIEDYSLDLPVTQASSLFGFFQGDKLKSD